MANHAHTRNADTCAASFFVACALLIAVVVGFYVWQFELPLWRESRRLMATNWSR